MKKRIGNDISFAWHIYRKDGDTQVPEDFTGKDVEVKLISPLQRPVTIENVSIATGVVTFTFRGKHQVTLGNYVAVLQENTGENGMVTLDVVSAVTLVPHSYMEEDGDEGDVIEAESVELTSEITASGGIVQQQADWAQTDASAVDYIKNKPDLDVFCRKDMANVHTGGYDRYRHEYEQIDAETTIQGNGILSCNYNKDGSLREMTSFIPGSIALIKDGVTLSLSYRYFANLIASIQAKADVADLASLVNTGTYNSTSKKIELKHDNNVLAEIDATAFIKDGMVDSVVVSNGYIVITFNTDAGKETIRIPVTDIFDPSNYYDKDDVDGLLAGKVDKIEGKGLSTNDYTTAEKIKLGALPTNEELTQALGGKADSADLAEVATSGSYNDLSDKPDLSGFITNSVDNLVNYYLKSETYTKNEVQQLIGAIQQFHYEVYPTLPQTGASNVLYLIGPTGTGADKYEEYVYANNEWTKIGDTSIDLSGYVTTQALNTALADYVTSSALSVTLANYYNKNDVDVLLANTVAESGVYDVTANNNNAKFASLSALLSSENLDTLIPSAKRKGGMSIKFVLSSDNKYVQYRLMSDTFSTTESDWQGVDNVPIANSKNLVTSGGVYDALLREYVVATAAANTGSVATAMIGIYDVNDVLIVEGEGEVTARLLYGKTYKVKCSRVYDYLTPAEQTFVASIPSRQVTMQYTYIERDVVTLDQTISDSAQMLSGDIQGNVIKDIRSHSHLYLGTPATQSGDTEGTELLCQLSDEDSRLYYDGTPAALDGSEGDQWLKLPVFWWKVVGVGEAAADGAHDQYRLMFAYAGEPDPSWNKWQGDRNLVGAKEMKVIDGKGRSVSGGESTGGFTKAQGNAYAAARNLGCQQVTWEWQWMMCVLFYAWYGNTNSQAVCGIGSDSYTRTLGVTDQLGMTDTTPAQATSLTSARFWGLEAWWNCKAEWMGNVVMENYVLSITDQNTKQMRQVSGFIQCGGSGGWSSRMRIDANGDFVPLAKAGTQTTFYCDYVNSTSGSRVLLRSYGNANAYGGVACVIANSAHSYASASVGSRLAFNGVITEAESVAAYKAALA